MEHDFENHDAPFGRGFPRRGAHDFGKDFGRHGHRHPGGPWGFAGFEGFGPEFFGRGPRARRGDVRDAILGLLAEGSYNGYGLIKAIGEKTDGAWQPSPGSVYPTLAQLVDEGLVAQEGGPRGSYSLTDAGRTWVDAHKEQIDAAFDKSSGLRPGDDEMFAAFKKLVGAAMQFRSTATVEQRRQAAAKIDALRRELYAILAE